MSAYSVVQTILTNTNMQQQPNKNFQLIFSTSININQSPEDCFSIYSNKHNS